MLAKKTLDNIKQSLIIMSLGLVLSVVPFYFQTKSITEDNQERLIEHELSLDVQAERLKRLEVQGAVDKAEIIQIKESLDRIEQKIDRLIERDNR